MRSITTILMIAIGYFMPTSSDFLSFEKSEDEKINVATLDYIDQYKDLAVAEMHRSGIPASIILAQGILESNSGLSTLASNSNNHFGIKCKRHWKGRKYYHKDDDYDKKGNLTESCFRAYENSIDSYIDHSNFLMYRKHYQTLFQYEKWDYYNWAHGLKACGYATDKKYAEKLIKKIELYNLNMFDSWANPFELIYDIRNGKN